MNDVGAPALPGICDVHIPGGNGSAACQPHSTMEEEGRPSANKTGPFFLYRKFGDPWSR